jgi:hypothetical protein
MLNRILNGELPEPTRARLIAVLRAAADSAAADAGAREQAQEFLKQQD